MGVVATNLEGAAAAAAAQEEAAVVVVALAVRARNPSSSRATDRQVRASPGLSSKLGRLAAK